MLVEPVYGGISDLHDQDDTMAVQCMHKRLHESMHKFTKQRKKLGEGGSEGGTDCRKIRRVECSRRDNTPRDGEAACKGMSDLFTDCY